MNTEHVEVGTDYSGAQLAETFLYHRVLIISVVDSAGGHRRSHEIRLFRRLGERFLQHR